MTENNNPRQNCESASQYLCWRVAVLGELASSQHRPDFVTDQLIAEVAQTAPINGACGNSCWQITGSHLRHLIEQGDI